MESGMDVDRKAFIESVGGEAQVARMSHEARADALEDFQTRQLDESIAAKTKASESWSERPDAARGEKPLLTVAELADLIDKRDYRRGEGKLFSHPNHIAKGSKYKGPTVSRLPPMPAKPTLIDFFKLRFGAAAHLLQSAALARRKGLSEEIVMACLLHDMGSYFMKAEHGYFGSQIIEPYVSEKITFAVRYHQCLRFFPDESVGYEYPTGYYKTFGTDYVPSPYITAEAEFARNHKWYMEARQVTMNDLYSFDPNAVIHIEEFEDIIGRHFRVPEEGLGYDRTPVSHMWRAMINPDAPL
jgi:hypothetical protein